jgi:fructose-1-phosphate kinase PfkB-like protein
MTQMALGMFSQSRLHRITLIVHSDAFAGGFVAGIVQGKSLETSIDMGQWLAKLSIQELGPSYPSPKQTYSG